MDLSSLVNPNIVSALSSRHGVVFAGILSITGIVIGSIITENHYVIRGQRIGIYPIRAASHELPEVNTKNETTEATIR